VLRDGESTVTVFYGNRRTNTVMFADELADLKDRYGTRLQLVHVLSREPRDAELTSGRLDGDRLRTLVENLVDAEHVDHWWLCGPHGMVTDARALLAELGVPAEKGAPGAVLRRRRPAAAGPRRRRDRRPARAARSPSSSTAGRPRWPCPGRAGPRLGAAGARRPAVRLQGRGLRHLPGAGHRRRGGDAPQLRARAEEVEAGYVLTCQTLPVSDAVTVDFDA
jgi:ring-1,2-phenylacetyl-CoA epoxidase subunit PaaE